MLFRSRFFGTEPQFWMDLQTAYDLHVAENLAGEQVRREVTPAAEWAAPPLAA